jgi:hypothetical protein
VGKQGVYSLWLYGLKRINKRIHKPQKKKTSVDLQQYILDREINALKAHLKTKYRLLNLYIKK